MLFFFLWGKSSKSGVIRKNKENQESQTALYTPGKKYCNTLIFFSSQICEMQVFYYWQKFTQECSKLNHWHIEKLKFNVVQFIS